MKNPEKSGVSIGKALCGAVITGVIGGILITALAFLSSVILEKTEAPEKYYDVVSIAVIAVGASLAGCINAAIRKYRMIFTCLITGGTVLCFLYAFNALVYGGVPENPHRIVSDILTLALPFVSGFVSSVFASGKTGKSGIGKRSASHGFPKNAAGKRIGAK